MIASRTLDNALYLSTSTHWNNSETFLAFDWFKKKLRVVLHPNRLEWGDHTVSMLNKGDPGLKEKIIRFLTEADTDIHDIEVGREKITEEHMPENMPEELKHILLGSSRWNIKTHHRAKHGDGSFDVAFDIEEESGGTKKMIEFVGPVIDVLTNGLVLVIDELECGLHPHLAEYMIRLFHGPKQNKNDAQLIFTTHNANLMDLDIFRRDQIWFVQKNEEKSTELYSLAEFRVRKDADIKNRYLSGRYGAIPFLGDGDIL